MSDWRHDAACRGEDPELWFPAAEEETRDYWRQAQLALAVCRGCLVRRDCLDWAVNAEPYGIWGNTTPAVRAELRRERRTEGSNA